MLLCPSCKRPGSERFVANLSVSPCADMFHYRADRASELWQMIKNLVTDTDLASKLSPEDQALYAEILASEKPASVSGTNEGVTVHVQPS